MQTASIKHPVTLVNAEGQILGRMGSKVAKLLLNGEEVIILNAIAGSLHDNSAGAGLTFSGCNQLWGIEHRRNLREPAYYQFSGANATIETKIALNVAFS